MAALLAAFASSPPNVTFCHGHRHRVSFTYADANTTHLELLLRLVLVPVSSPANTRLGVLLVWARKGADAAGLAQKRERNVMTCSSMALVQPCTVPKLVGWMTRVICGNCLGRCLGGFWGSGAGYGRRPHWLVIVPLFPENPSGQVFDLCHTPPSILPKDELCIIIDMGCV